MWRVGGHSPRWAAEPEKIIIIINQDDDVNDNDVDDYDYDHDKQKQCSEESRLIIIGLTAMNSKQQLHQSQTQHSLASVSPTERGVFQPG
jgi:hypothetical protein